MHSQQLRTNPPSDPEDTPQNQRQSRSCYGPGGDGFALCQNGLEAVGESGQDRVGCSGAGHEHGLLIQRSEDGIDELGAHRWAIARRGAPGGWLGEGDSGEFFGDGP